MPVIADNNVIIYTIDGQLRSFSIFDGTERWSLSQDVPSLTLRGSSTPVVLGNNIIVGFDNGRMISVNIETGMVIWEAMLSPPSGRSDLERLTDIDGVIKVFGQDIFVAGYQSQLVSVAAESGQTIWSKELSSEVGIEIDDESIYLVTDQGFLLGLSRKDGSEVWREEILTRRELTAPVRFKSTIVVGDLEGYVHFFDSKSGELVARRRSGKGAVSGVPVVIDEYLYVQNESGTISVFSAPSPEENKDSKRFSLWGT
jgi:outer membrane protein assembly factor BamB